MDTQNAEGADGKSCCDKKGKCCGCKALAAVALLVVGGIGGYFMGRHCGSCAVKTEAPAAAAPAQTPAK